MKKYLKPLFALTLLLAGVAAYALNQNTPSPNPNEPIMLSQKNIAFINASANKDGNTADYAKRLLAGHRYQQINLIDYKLYPLGANFPDDQFQTVYQQLAQYDVLVIGTPVYWHTVSGALKVFIDRLYNEDDNKLKGKTLIFIAQGFDPTPVSIEQMDYMIKRFANKYDLKLVGIAHSLSDIEQIKQRIK